MKRMIQLALLSALAVSSAAQAATQYHMTRLSYVYPQSDGSFAIGFVTSPSTCSSAGNPKSFFVTAGQVGVTADGVKAMLATALTAFGMDLPVSIAFDDSTASCYVMRLSVERS